MLYVRHQEPQLLKACSWYESFCTTIAMNHIDCFVCGNFLLLQEMSIFTMACVTGVWRGDQATHVLASHKQKNR